MVTTEPRTPPMGEAGMRHWIGQVVADRYRVLEVIGEGGMGSVFVAEHMALRKQVALKIIRAEFAGDEQLEARFAREALATGQLDHPHVASAMDFGRLPDGAAFLVTQLVRGRSLAKHLEQGPMTWAQAAELGAQIADALAAAHAAGIVHRDLKPENILIEPRGEALFARVVDFGIARLAADSGTTVIPKPLTQIGMVVGSPGYMAPEQALGEQAEASADLYALGVIVWEAIAGRRLWGVDSLGDLYTVQLSTTPPALHTLPGSQVPVALSELVAGLLQTTPAQRPAPAAFVRDELRRMIWAAAAGSGQAPARSPPPAVMKAASARPAPPESPRPTPPRRRARLLLLAAGVAAASLLVLVTRPAWRASEDGGEAPETVAAEPAPAGERPAAPAAVDVAAAIPEAYAEPARVLLYEPGRKDRKAAAETITSAPESLKATIPEHIRNVAWLERATTCEAKKKVLKKIEDADDPRAVSALHILSHTPRNTCKSGLFGKGDCLECLRTDLARVIRRLEAHATPR
jgi:hypothetical protein